MNPEIFGELQGSEMVISRLVAAPQELVFRALTSPNHLANWWGPEGFRITTLAWDFREGGQWRFIMHGPDGTDYPNRMIYRKISHPDCLEYIVDDDGHSDHKFQGSLELKPEGDATRITLRARFATEAEALAVEERVGAIEGGKQTLGRLAAFLAEVPGEFDLLLQREFPVSVETLFAAWTQPEHLLKWWGPEVFTNRECHIDLRPGGDFLVVMVSPEGVDYPALGKVLEVQQPHKLVLELRVEDPPGNLVLQTRAEANFDRLGDGASLRLKVITTHCVGRGLMYVQGMEAGWSQSLGKLQQTYTK